MLNLHQFELFPLKFYLCYTGTDALIFFSVWLISSNDYSEAFGMCMRCLLAVHLQPFLRVTAAAEAGVETSVSRTLMLQRLV